MRLTELYESSPTPLKLRIDNPGGEWLEQKREDAIASGQNRFGGPARFGACTAVWNRKVLLPVKLIASFPGVNGEHDRPPRESSYDWLKDNMKDGRLPKFHPDDDGQYAPFITVWQDGTPWISEGNQRIKVARELGWEFIPIEMRYFNGAESVNGPLSPAEVKRFDEEAVTKGYSPDTRGFSDTHFKAK